MLNERPSNVYEDEIDLFELWTIIWKRRKFIVIFSITAILLVTIISLFMTDIYKAEATVIPVFSGEEDFYESLTELSIKGKRDEATTVMVVPDKSRVDRDKLNKILMIIANSRTFKEQVVNDRDFVKHIDSDTSAHPSLSFTPELFSISADNKTGLITLAFEWEDPKVAAQMVNRYVDLLKEALESKALNVEGKRLKNIEETKGEISLEIIDRAIPPEKKIKPKRSLMVMVAAMSSFFMAIFIVFFMEWLENAKNKAGAIKED